jgi:hypothetical protein
MPPTAETHLIATFESWLEAKLPSGYADFLAAHQEALYGDRVLMYGASSLQERNETLETKTYCAGYIAIGDDSGGRAVVIALAEPLHQVFLVDMGYMDPDGFQPIPLPFDDWLRAGCPCNTD